MQCTSCAGISSVLTYFRLLWLHASHRAFCRILPVFQPLPFLTSADATVEGLTKSGVEVKVFRVPELLPEEVLEKMGAKGLPHNEGIPLVDRETVHEADGFLWGFPTRFGMMVRPHHP